MNKIQKQTGFTLIELMVSLAIGLFLIAGVFYIYLNSHQSQKTVEAEVRLIDNARFALETISFDLKHAGIYGTLNHEDRGKVDPTSMNLFQTISGQCGAADSGWVVNVENAVLSSNDINPYSDSCITPTKYSNGDVLEMRYVNRIDQDEDLFDNVLYVNSDSASAEFFLGSAAPVTTRPLGRNYEMVVKTYYISSYTDEVDDGIPSLRMLTLQPGTTGPVVEEILLLSGVTELQMQFGLVADNVSADSTSVVTWVNPPTDPAVWKRVIAARIWLVMQSNQRMPEINTATSLEVAGVNVDYPNDGFRRVMVTTSVRLRNMNTGY